MIDPVEHFIYRMSYSSVRWHPFPHFFIEDVFPDWFYNHVRKALRSATRFETMSDYPNRKFSGELPDDIKEVFASPKIGGLVAGAFCLPSDVKYTAMIRWTRDRQGYFLEPHTDSKDKAATLLFYTPPVYDDEPVGTSIYLPKDRAMTSDGTKHHRREDFDLIHTFPFRANSVFGMMRTDNSFHGVEPITTAVQRDTLFYTLNAGN